jgi:type III pantothenate kinase
VRPEKIIGTDTVACMHSGVFWGYVGLIEGIVMRILDEFAKPMKVLSTGGLAPVFEGATDVIDANVPDITMRGLREIYRRSRGV